MENQINNDNLQPQYQPPLQQEPGMPPAVPRPDAYPPPNAEPLPVDIAKLASPGELPPQPLPPLLETRGLCKSYGRNQALDNISFVLPRGRIIGLLGPNGSGKTTLLKLACGLITPSLGQLLINGQPPGIASKSVVAYLPEKSYLNDWMRVGQLLDFFAEFYTDFDRVRAGEMVRMLRIDENARLKTLSKGTQEKVQLILVMSRDAELYLLDEPIGGVDPAAREYIINTIIGNYRENATVLISTHIITDIEAVLDDVIFLDRGRIVLQNSVDTLREQSGKSVDQMFREVFRC